MQDRNWGYKALLEGLGEGLDARSNAMESLKKIKALEDFYESHGLDRTTAHQPDFVQKEAAKKIFRPKSLGEHVSSIADRLFGTGSSSNQFTPHIKELPTIIRGNDSRPVGVQIGSQLISADQISPETIQKIEMLEQQNAQTDQQPSTFGTKAGNFLSGLGTRAAGLASGGDIAGLLGSGVSSLRNLVETPETREAQKSKWAERLKGLSPQQISSLAQEGAFNELASPEEVSEAAMDFVPTTETLRKGIGKATKDTGAEKYVASKNPTDEIWRELGDITGILSNPLKGAGSALTGGAQGIEKAKDVAPFAQKILGNIKEVSPAKLAATTGNILKASGIALAGKGAGWLTEAVTGNEKLGKVIQNGTYLAYSLFPGLAGKLGQKSYNDYESQVINPAVEQGKKIDLSPLKEQLDTTIGKKIDRLSANSEAASYLRNEAAILQDTIDEAGGKISPDALWTNIKEMGKRAASNKAPDQAQGILKQMIDVQKDLLKKFSDTVIPDGGKLLENANDFWKTSHAIDDAQKIVRESLNPKAFNAGALFWLGGGYKLLMKLSMAESARQFATKMMQSPAVRDAMGELFKASTSQNAALVKKSLDDLESSSNKVLKGLPAKDRAEIIKALKESQRAQTS